jgi:hypothetical protein
MRRVLLLLALALVMGGCWKKRVKHLSATEFDHYYALRPFMDEDLQKGFLKGKTEAERNEFLETHSFQGKVLWEIFYQYDQAKRDAIVAGDVTNGFSADMVLMAWGKPYDKKKLVGRPASRSEMYIYRFEVQEDGTIMIYDPEDGSSYHAIRRFTREVVLDDNSVTEINEHNGW